MSPRERIEFQHHAGILKNERLGAAFAFMTKIKSDRHEDLQEKLFQLLYKKAWTKDNDYLLRNDLRLLGRQLELYLARKLFDQTDKRFEAEASCLCLTALLERQQPELFLREWQQIMRSAEVSDALNYAIRLWELRIQ